MSTGTLEPLPNALSHDRHAPPSPRPPATRPEAVHRPGRPGTPWARLDPALDARAAGHRLAVLYRRGAAHRALGERAGRGHRALGWPYRPVRRRRGGAWR